MLFPEEDAPLLKTWIVKRLENTSDADADVLADYVLALLRHDGDVETVRELCETEIPDFLKEDSTIFVRDVFDTIQYRSYLPGVMPPRRSSVPFAPPSGPSAPPYGIGAPMGPQNGSRKRTYNDRGEFDAPDRGFIAGGDPSGRYFKQPRRGGSSMGRGGFDNYPVRGGGGYNAGRPPPMNIPQGLPGHAFPGVPSPPPGMPPFDPNNPMAALLAMQALGFAVPGLQSFAPDSSPVGSPGAPPIIPSKPRCRDYDLKGFCARGNTCNFEHGEHPIWVPPAREQRKSDEYDPSTSLLPRPEVSNGPVPNIMLGQFQGSGRGRGRGGFVRGDGRQFSNPARKNGRAEFSSDRANFDKTNTTIVVENIPEEKFSEEEVREFFAEFGEILEVDMRPYKRLAIVKFDEWNSANNAYRSPKVIFDNRFVKVYWFVDQESLPKPPANSSATTNGPAKNGSSINAIPVAARATEEPQIDLEEFARKQEEAQKTHEEKLKKKEEMEAMRKELERRQEELVKKQAEEKKKLLEKIAKMEGKSSVVEPVIMTESGTPTPSESKKSGASTQTEALKAQLAALEDEAKSLGIDTSLSEEPAWGPPTRGRGRGRGGYRGRGAYVPRGFRGGYRGRGGAPFAPNGRSFNLDNRPKKIALTGIDFSDPEKDESLRQYLLGVGEYTDLEVTPSKTSITFKDRFTAEKFMFGLPSNSEIPSVGKVDLAWVQTPLPPVNLNPPLSSKPKVEDRDVDVHMEGDAMAATSSPSHAHAQEQAENIDYDVADDNEWGVQ